jgi:hypothetical protein
LADAGPEAVTAKAAEIRSGKAPVADDPERPWAQFEADIEDCISDLRAAKKKLSAVVELDDAKRFMNKWARGLSFLSTVDQIQSVIRNIKDGMPAKIDKKPPGYLTVRQVQSAASFHKHNPHATR